MSAGEYERSGPHAQGNTSACVHPRHEMIEAAVATCSLKVCGIEGVKGERERTRGG